VKNDMPNIISPCELSQKVDRAIQYIKSFEPETEPYYVAYSGGKDSDTIKILCQLANVKADFVHNLTSVDAPETIQYIKSQKDVIIEKPRYKDGTHKTMWNLIPKKKMPPTRIVRYCCSELKESNGIGRVTMTGVRWAESKGRKDNQGLVNGFQKPKHSAKLLDEFGAEYKINKNGGVILNNDNDSARRFVEHCYRTQKILINPIIDWEDSDVWNFLNHYGCKSNPLYECGQKRIGCIGCPIASAKGQKKEFAQYPKYYNNYIKAFDKMLIPLKQHNPNITWETGLDVMKWWLGDDPDQITFEDI